jgi:hypothetical protein
MRKTGNLFLLAEQQLIKEIKRGEIPCYTDLDVLEYAIFIRKVLDKNPGIKLPLSDREKRKYRQQINRKYYLKRRQK